MTVLNDQRMLFVDEYIKLRCANAKQAAINAGYSAKSAAAQASQILNDPKVQEYLKQRKSEISQDLKQEFMFDALEARELIKLKCLENSEYTPREAAETLAEMVNAEVITFERMAFRVINEIGGIENNLINNVGKAMLLTNIIEKQKEK